MTAGLMVAIVAGAACLSVMARAGQIRRTYDAQEGIEPAESPLSKALQESLATAAGIYMALAALSVFLKIQVPAVNLPWGISVDPLPVLALLLTIIQPVFGR